MGGTTGSAGKSPENSAGEMCRGAVLDEGYVKYCCEYTAGDAPRHDELAALNALRTELHDAGLIGMYDSGIGYGNISVRDAGAGAGKSAGRDREQGAERSGKANTTGSAGIANSFVISATATGRARVLPLDAYCRVTAYHLAQNTVFCTGKAPASSEAMTHGAVYGANAAVRCVVHIHSPKLFAYALNNGTPATAQNAAYGTPAMAFSVAELVAAAKAGRENCGEIVMTGHEEGMIFYGESIERVRGLVQNFVKKAA